MKRAHPSPRGEEKSGGEVPPSLANGISADVIEAELEKILASPVFVHSERHSSFLRFVVESALKGEGEQLKEYLLGVEVFGRGEGFDPRTDSIVRTEATRLRSKLTEYYERDGQNDPVVIELNKGSYRPQFRKRGIGAGLACLSLRFSGTTKKVSASGPVGGRDLGGIDRRRVVVAVSG